MVCACLFSPIVGCPAQAKGVLPYFLRYTLLLMTISVFSSGCLMKTSTTSKVVSVEKGTEKSGMFFNQLIFSEAASQSIYIEMLEKEIASGISVEQGRMHTTNGYFHCRQNGVLKKCQLTVDIAGVQSKVIKIDQDISEDVREFAIATDASLENSKYFLLEVVCDYIGKKSPPFGVETVKCKSQFPFDINEFVLSGTVSKELSKSLPPPEKDSQGLVLCDSARFSKGLSCELKALKDDGSLADSVKNLSPKAQNEFKNAILFRTAFENKKHKGFKAKNLFDSDQYLLNLVCYQNPKDKNMQRCKIKLPVNDR